MEFTEVDHPFSLSEDLSGNKMEFAQDLFYSPKVPRKRRTRKSHYAAPPPAHTNPESRPIIKPVSER
jgi:hypothetical protein